jgi:2',3'-cyclic-nucleotide 2'-phosphodiesterase (5'-nucleotidase family)
MPVSRLRRTRGPVLLAIVAVIALLVPLAASVSAKAQPTVDIQFLNVSDWHGQLDPNTPAGAPAAGGAGVLASYFAQDRAAVANTITLTAGDDFGATQPLAGFFNEEPAVVVQRMMGIQVGTFGNHNFDRGVDHLQQMIDLAGSTDPNVPGKPFQYVASNLNNRDAELSGVADYKIFQLKGVKVAVIGAVNEEAPGLVFPGNFGTITPSDAVAAVNRARDAARAEGAKVFVVITHKGVTGFNTDGSAKGELIDFAKQLQGYHVIFGDHTDVQWSGQINGQLVTENRSKGLTYSRTNLTVLQGSARVVDFKHEFVSPVTTAVTPNAGIAAYLQPLRVELAKVFDGKVAVATGSFPRGGNVERRSENALGNLIADAIRTEYGTQIAFINSGGVRSPLPSTYVPQDPNVNRTTAPYDIVIGDSYTILPFGNSVVTRDVTGAQLWAALENGVSRINPDGSGTDGRFPQISGFRFTYDGTRAPGSRVLTVALNDGTPIPNSASFSVTMAAPDFINTGGDGYTMFLDGIATTRELMADVFLGYLEEQGTVTPTLDGRIDNVAHPTF